MGGGDLLDTYNNLSEELLTDTIEKDNIIYHIPDKTNILLNKIEGRTNKIVQLLDYTDYRSTITNNGVTFTNNGNGLIIINGTAGNAAVYAQYGLHKQNTNQGKYPLTIKKGHKYLIDAFGDNARSDLYVVIGSANSIGFQYGEPRENLITTANADATETYFIYRLPTGKTVTNEYVGPRIYDLTEIYGVGNEPTTYEQFKKDYTYLYETFTTIHSDSIYSTKVDSIALTNKNIFNYTELRQPKDDTRLGYDYANSTLIEYLDNGVIVQGNSGNNNGRSDWNNGWYRPGCLYGYVQKDLDYLLQLKKGDVVTISADYTLLSYDFGDETVDTVNIGIYTRFNNGSQLHSGKKVKVGEKTRLYQTYTITVDNKYFPIFTLNSGKAKIENIQIEYGSTATDYVPYTEESIELPKSKNLFDYRQVTGALTQYGGNIDYRLIINENSFMTTWGLYSNVCLYNYPLYLNPGIYTLSCIAYGNNANGGDDNTIYISVYKKVDSEHYYAFGTATLSTGSISSRIFRTFTITEYGEYYIAIQGRGTETNAQNLNTTVRNIQLEKGDTATGYMPYEWELYGNNKKSDSISVQNNGDMYDIYYNHNAEEFSFSGSEGWYIGESKNGWKIDGDTIPFYIFPGVLMSNGGVICCNKFITDNTYQIVTGDSEAVGIYNNYLCIRIAKSKLSEVTTTAFSTYLKDLYTAKDPVKAWYFTNSTKHSTKIDSVTFNEVSKVRTVGGMIRVKGNENKDYARPTVAMQSNYSYKN